MSKRFLSGINVIGSATLNTVADANTNTGKFLVLDSSNNVSYRTSAELYSDLGISSSINARSVAEFTTDGTTAVYSSVYTVGQVDVFYNGAKLATTEFTATNGTSVTLGFIPPASQLVSVTSWVTGGGVSNGRTLTINGVTYDLSANRSWTISSSSVGAQPQLNGTGFVKASGTTISYDNSTYLTTASASSTYQTILTNPVTGTATSGYVSFWTGSNSIAGVSNFFWDNTNIRLGIGLNNPQRALEIYSTTADSHLRLSGSAPSMSLGEAITGSSYQAKFGLATSAGQYATGAVAGDLVIISQTGATMFGAGSVGASFVKLTSSGNFEIGYGGTSQNAYKLDIYGTARFTSDALISSLTVGKGTANIATNTAIGYQALLANTTGDNGVSVGYNSLRYNTTGAYNVAIGSSALYTNTTGAGNIAIGFSSLYANITGNTNVAIGFYTLQANTTGGNNMAIGFFSLYSNTTGGNNVGVGIQSLNNNTTGHDNVGIGISCIYSNTIGNFNTGVGNAAINGNTTGNNNTAIGYQSGYGAIQNTTGSNNIFIGYQSIGVSATESNRTWIGNSSTTSTWLAGNLLIGTTTDAGYKLDVNGTARVQGIITGSVNGGTLTLGTATTNSTAIAVTGYFTNTGAITTNNNNSRGFSIDVGSQEYAFQCRYFGNGQSVVTSNTYYSAYGNINITAGTIDLKGFHFSPTIVNETNATIKGFVSSLNSAINRWNLFIDGNAANYLAGNLLLGTTSNLGYKLDVNGTGRFTGVLTLGSTLSNGTYTYTLPSATGTLALTSALSSYLPLSGGTLTGALSGTSATFSSSVTSVGSSISGAIAFTPSSFAVGSASATDANSLTLQAANSNYLLRFKNAAGSSIGGFYYDGTSLIIDPSLIKITGAATFSNVIILKGYTVATLPTGVQGATAFVTDALAATYMASVVGGGAVVLRVFYNGSTWTCQ